MGKTTSTWIRKSDEDRRLKRFTLIPTQVVSNEEFIPMPQSADQKRLEKRISELADDFLPYRGVFDFGDARRLMHPISLDDDTRPAMIPGNIPQS